MNQSLNSNLQKLLTLHEGKKLKPYVDTVGKITIGIGRNLTDVGISEAECSFLLSNDIENAYKKYKNNFPNWELDEVRQLVVLDMIFNMGINKFLYFRRFIEAIQRKDYLTAADEMRDSAWFIQTKTRGERLFKMMKTGEMPPELTS